MKVLGGDILLRCIYLPAEAEHGTWRQRGYDLGCSEVSTYLGDWVGSWGDVFGLSSGEVRDGPDHTSSEPSPMPGEERRDSAGLSEPQELGEAITPEPKTWGFTCWLRETSPV